MEYTYIRYNFENYYLETQPSVLKKNLKPWLRILMHLKFEIGP